MSVTNFYPRIWADAVINSINHEQWWQKHIAEHSEWQENVIRKNMTALERLAVRVKFSKKFILRRFKITEERDYSSLSFVVKIYKNEKLIGTKRYPNYDLVKMKQSSLESNSP
jgi:hypothetical protein